MNWAVNYANANVIITAIGAIRSNEVCLYIKKSPSYTNAVLK